MINIFINICNILVYVGCLIFLGFFVLLDVWMCRNRGICEYYLNLYYYIIYLINCIYENLSISYILKVVIVIVYFKFNFNLYLLVKGLYFFINFELDF